VIKSFLKVAYRTQWRAEGGGKHGDGPRHRKQGGIQRVKVQKLKCCSKMISPVVRLLTDATWI